MSLDTLTINWFAVLCIASLYLFLYLLGSRASRRTAILDFTAMTLAGRRLPLGIGILTVTATWVGGGYLNGTVEAIHLGGLWNAQAPWGYALSLIIGGLWFAPTMRRLNCTTMLDPFQKRYGPRVAAWLYIPALMGEVFWTAAILTALGVSFEVIAGIPFTPGVILSVIVAMAYTARSGLWAVAITDVVQLALLLVGLSAAAWFASVEVGGITLAWTTYSSSEIAQPPMSWIPWSDAALLLICGGIPWHAYFQRVLATKSPSDARRLSVWAGGLSLTVAIPAMAIGVIGTSVNWSQLIGSNPDAAMILPLVLRYLTSPVVATLGLTAMAAAVMSSVDSSILSASSMATWNIYRPLLKPEATSTDLKRIIRRLIFIVGCTATLIALNTRSVYSLWFLSSDFVYCILFPQLVCALYDRRANWIGASAGYIVAFTLRLGAGEPLLGLTPFISYAEDVSTGLVWFPFRTFAMLAGLFTIIGVSRLTRGRCPAVQLEENTQSE